MVLERLERAFGGEAAVVHSGQGPAERSRALWSVARGERRLVLGGRAAIFAPAFPPGVPLGLVVVHGEADRTLKEQRSPYYDAREVALARAEASGAALILAAEAPSLRSLHRASDGGDPRAVRQGGDVMGRRCWTDLAGIRGPGELGVFCCARGRLVHL